MAEEKFMQEAIELSRKGMQAGEGGPFGCVIVKDGVVVGRGNNKVIANTDPTAHAEMVAIRDACKTLGSFQLDGCEVYTSCEPCPMCLGAIYWARPKAIYYAANRADAQAAGFDDSFIYEEIALDAPHRHIPMKPMDREAAQQVFEEWKVMEGKTRY